MSSELLFVQTIAWDEKTEFKSSFEILVAEKMSWMSFSCGGGGWIIHSTNFKMSPIYAFTESKFIRTFKSTSAEFKGHLPATCRNIHAKQSRASPAAVAPA